VLSLLFALKAEASVSAFCKSKSKSTSLLLFLKSVTGFCGTLSTPD
jgi:hypothetical protein